MSDFDKNKDIRRKKFYTSQRDRDGMSFTNTRKNIYKYEREPREVDKIYENKDKTVPQPTILLKNREHNERAVSPKRPASSETETPNIQPTSIQKAKQPPVDLSASLWCPLQMEQSVKLIDENSMFFDTVQEYLLDNSMDFLVVGILGGQGSGKSTILNLLSHNTVDSALISDIFDFNAKNITKVDSNVKNVAENLGSINLDQKQNENTETKDVKQEDQKTNTFFKTQTLKDIERGDHSTNGIDIYVTSNRLIVLDTQPILSLSIFDKMVQTDNKATAAGEVVSTENSSEIQSLQLAAFILTVCHVVILVQDWFFDPNIIRFIQAAEMLKPSTSSGGEEEVNEHSPHLLLLHNKATMQDFSPTNFKIMQKIYHSMFKHSKLRLESGLGIAGGNIIHSLCPSTCGEPPLNIFLLSEVMDDNDDKQLYRGYPKIEELIRKLKSQIQGATRSPLTHTQLSERTWLHYASKAWDAVKKSSFFVEYNKLLP